MSFTDIYVRNKYTGRIHRVGDDVHDSFWVDRNGTLLYHNMHNGDGCTAFKSINTKKDINGDGYEEGFEFVPMMDGEMAEPYATQYQEQKEKEKKWKQVIKDLEERTANLKPDEIPEDL